MTTLDVELERDKAQKIAQVAARGAAIAVELGQDPDLVQRFLSHYFRHVDALDVDERSVAELYGLVENHFRTAAYRTPPPPGEMAEPTIVIQDPSQVGDGWTPGGITVVQIVTDDRPFLVDSVTMELLRLGWSIREVFHPQFFVRRDGQGRLSDIVGSAEAVGDASVRPESWMHLEILPPARPDDPDALAAELETGIRQVLRLVGAAVRDWQAMLGQAAHTLTLLSHDERTDQADGSDTEVARARELLRWLIENHFTFLGFREYRLTEADGRPQLVGVPGTGLGILDGDNDVPGAFHALPQQDAGSDPPPLMVITKDNYKSRVHRPAYLDYVGFRTFAPDGSMTGERRFLGLFASKAYSEAVARVPLLRQKSLEILRRSGYDELSHGGKAIMDVLDSYPRDELFQTSVDELAPVVEKVAHLKERRQVRLFVRRDVYGRYLSCLVYLPRDRYTTAVRNRMQEILTTALGDASIDYTARVSESVLARLHFVLRMPVGESIGEIDTVALERELTHATRSWNDEFADLVADAERPQRLAALVGALPEGYKEDYSARQALLDLSALTALTDETESAPGFAGTSMASGFAGTSMASGFAGTSMASGFAGTSMAMYVPDREGDEAHLRLKIFRREESLSLSKVLPHLTLLGVDVIDERPYELQLGAADELGRRAYIYDFGVTVPGGADAVRAHWTEAARERFMEAFLASYRGASEPDSFNALVMGANLSWRQVSILRTVGRYLRQAGATYSQSYIAQALRANVDLAPHLVALFETKFDPELEIGMDARAERVRVLHERIETALNDVASLDHDRIIRSFLAVLEATIRTNFFQTGRNTVALKLLPREIADLPEPRPAYEIFVYSPRLEGVHLRFGSVARGGLRWSDRAEDFRTEILGLVKAQMVKNTVIVPVGAKGGFYAKKLPDPNVDREAWLAEGVACYQLFISSLLDLTDNIVTPKEERGNDVAAAGDRGNDVVTGAVVPPEDLVRYDDDDPYLVVAADKGTASFSDIANRISLSRGFWLGDAFASGGSAGYDHKAMGITARGAWESVQRHFREMGTDPQTQDFTCVGIGDMSGDVFGNGMLLSQHTLLVAAFDHRHIFLDPDPDPTASWEERARMFALPRSSWADYDASLISEGGGVYSRSLKSVTVTPQVREVLGIERRVTALSPAELITACLKAPVDLLWNGGIGTYVKATSETHAQVGDKANDGLRVNGAELRARCVGEGGNLGLTQLGRIEYATRSAATEPGRVNTDFIDNSAGVDTSDHEVNIKILLAGEVAAGRLTTPVRDAFLASMTEEVGELVLRHNYDQNLALANGVLQAPSMAGVHEDWMQRLSDGGLLSRRIEFLPSTEEMENRRSERRGLTAPELATLMAYTKIVLAEEILASSLPDDPYLAGLLPGYFPSAMRERYAEAITRHRLGREIITTVVVNRFVNASGITSFHRLSSETGAVAADVIRGHVAARALFGADEYDRQIAALDHHIKAATQTVLRVEVRTLVERATRWLINNRRRPIDLNAAVEQFGPGVGFVLRELPTILTGRDAEAYERRMRSYTAAGVPEELAQSVAVLPAAYAALTIVQTSTRDATDVLRTAKVHFGLGQRLGLDRLLARIIELPRDDRWQTMARAALRDDLHAVHAQLAAVVLGNDTEATSKHLVAAWEKATPAAAESIRTLRTICDARPDLARMSVGLRVAKALLPAND